VHVRENTVSTYDDLVNLGVPSEYTFYDILPDSPQDLYNIQPENGLGVELAEI
jgi:hypothetical protein